MQDVQVLSNEQVEHLARIIAERTWARMRRYIARQQRELHDLLEEEE